MDIFHIHNRLTFADIQHLLNTTTPLALSAESSAQIELCRSFLDKKLSTDESPVYGINTGFGSLCDIKIDDRQLELLQHNLLLSHACGLGDMVEKDIVKLMLLLKIQSLSYGHSGVTLATVERLIAFYNQQIYPVVYEQGSLGASGDLAPLAHLCLPLIGEGKVHIEEEIINASALNFSPLRLKSKEGLALLNGTQFMSAYGVYILLEAERLMQLADKIACVSLDAFDCRPEPFDALIQQVRPHKGQIATAQRVMATLADSEIFFAAKEAVQDPYSFRCIPQIHGASRDVIAYVKTVFEVEINAVTDNPNIFPKEDKIISGGNFHGQPLAMALDYLAVAMAELGSVSERRTYLLISGKRGLPPFLVEDAGLNSGFMIPQYTAASIVSQNKQLCTPASIDSIPSSNGQEDHVSMGANAATKALKVLRNIEKLLAIELLNASQALFFRQPRRSSRQVEEWLLHYRAIVPFVAKDRLLHEDIVKTISFLRKMA